MASLTTAFLQAHSPDTPRLRELLAGAERALPKHRKTGDMPVNPSACDIDAVHKTRGEVLHRPLEADVIRAVEKLLAVHPRVLWALRMNSGAASYEAKSGKWAPVWFHRWVRSTVPMRMSDFLGARVEELFDRPQIFAIECKKPGWKKPTDQREREQAAFLATVRRHGGIALFATSAEQVAEALK